MTRGFSQYKRINVPYLNKFANLLQIAEQSSSWSVYSEMYEQPQGFNMAYYHALHGVHKDVRGQLD